MAPARVRDKSARDESRWDNGRKRRGRNRRKVPASAARTTTVRIGGSKPHEGGIRRAHKTSFVHSSPPPVTSRYLTSRRWTRADPPRIGRVKRNVRTPSDPSQPAGAPSTDRRHTQDPVHAETASSGRFRRYHPVVQVTGAAATPGLAHPRNSPWNSKGFRRVGSHHASPGSVLGASTRGRPRAHRQRFLLSRRWALAARQRRTIRSTRGRWAVTLRHQQFGQQQTDTDLNAAIR